MKMYYTISCIMEYIPELRRYIPFATESEYIASLSCIYYNLVILFQQELQSEL